MTRESDRDVSIITARFDDFKEEIIRRLDAIDERLGSKCDRCQNSTEFREKLTQHWWHILSIWGVLGAIIFVVINYKMSKLNDVVFDDSKITFNNASSGLSPGTALAGMNAFKTRGCTDCHRGTELGGTGSVAPLRNASYRYKFNHESEDRLYDAIRHMAKTKLNKDLSDDEIKNIAEYLKNDSL